MSMDPEPSFPEGNVRRRNDGGAILVLVALLLVFLLAIIGLAFDLGHAYVNKSELQNVADASALAGASALNGTAEGIMEADLRATDAGLHLSNRMEFNTLAVPIAQANVRYSVSLDGPWLDRDTAAVAPDGIRFVQTTLVDQPSPVFFGKVLPGIPGVFGIGASAVAGQEPLTQVCQGLDPFSAAPIRDEYGNNPPGPYFGYVIGNYYELRLASGSSGGTSGKSCSDQGLPGCVTGNFGMADSGGCGNGTPCWRDTIVNGSRDRCVQLDSNSLPTDPGNMGSNVPNYLEIRYGQDNDLTEYFGTPGTGGTWSGNFDDYNIATMVGRTDGGPYRRIIRVAFNDGNIPTGGSGSYYVQGFGCFWMITRPVVNPPSSAVCMMFVGQCNESGTPNGTNPSITKIVLFR